MGYCFFNTIRSYCHPKSNVTSLENMQIIIRYSDSLYIQNCGYATNALYYMINWELSFVVYRIIETKDKLKFYKSYLH